MPSGFLTAFQNFVYHQKTQMDDQEIGIDLCFKIAAPVIVPAPHKGVPLKIIMFERV